MFFVHACMNTILHLPWNEGFEVEEEKDLKWYGTQNNTEGDEREGHAKAKG